LTLRLSSWQRFIPVILLLAATSLLLEARDRIEVLPVHPALSDFPIQIADWHARDLPMNPRELEVLGHGEFSLRDYVSSPAEPPVNLFVAYFPSQRSGDTIHSPQNCLPGSGWAPLKSGHLSLQGPDGSTISINRYIIARGNDRDLVFYWYLSHGRVTSSEYSAKVYLAMDAIRLNRTDGALVRVVTAIPTASDEMVAQERAVRFVRQILPLLDTSIPN
jgi:EpsI family protein